MTKARGFVNFAPTDDQVLSGGVWTICRAHRKRSAFRLNLNRLSPEMVYVLRKHLNSLLGKPNMLGFEDCEIVYSICRIEHDYLFTMVNVVEFESSEKAPESAATSEEDTAPAPKPSGKGRPFFQASHTGRGKTEVKKAAAKRSTKGRSKKGRKAPKKSPTPPNGSGKLAKKNGGPLKKARENGRDAAAASHLRTSRRPSH